MQDLIESLSNQGVSLAINIGGKIITYGGRGLKPLLTAIEENGNGLKGATAADLVIGKAAAMLFAYAGISRVYALTLSKAGRDTLIKHNIAFEYAALTETVLNRALTDTCPMEKLCQPLTSPPDAYEKLRTKVNEMMKRL